MKIYNNIDLDTFSNENFGFENLISKEDILSWLLKIEKFLLYTSTDESRILSYKKYSFNFVIQNITKGHEKCAKVHKNDIKTSSIKTEETKHRLCIISGKIEKDKIFIFKIDDFIFLKFNFNHIENNEQNILCKLRFIEDCIEYKDPIIEPNRIEISNEECTLITLNDYWNILPFEKENFFKEYELDEIFDFVDLVMKNEHPTLFDYFTPHKYYEICRVAYESIGEDRLYEENSKEQFIRLSNVKINQSMLNDHSPNDFSSRIKENNSIKNNIFKIINGSGESSIELKVIKNNGYYHLSLSSIGFFAQEKIMRIYLGLENVGIKVELPLKKQYLNRFLGESILEIKNNKIYERIYNDDDILIKKVCWGSFQNELLDEYLKTKERGEIK